MTITRTPSPTSDSSARRGGSFRILFPLAMLVAVTALSYANAWPDTAVLDDKYFAGNEHLPEWSEPAEMFKGDLWRTPGGASGLYRPALLLSLSLDSKMFGAWMSGYHLSNIALHLAVTLCLYGFLLHLLRSVPSGVKRADLYALLAALVFAAHPVHTEAVNSVFNRSDMLVTLCGVAGLWWLIRFMYTREALAWTGLGVAYMLAMLSKENGLVLPGIAVAWIVCLSNEPWPRRIRRSLPALWLLLPLALYFYLRARGLSTGSEDQAAFQAEPGSPEAGQWIVGPEGLIDALGLWGMGLRLMVWPYPLKLVYAPLDPPGLAISIAVQALLLAAGLFQLRNPGRSALLAGLAWYYLAMLPASRLIVPGGEAEPFLGERNLYLPSAGLALPLAIGLAGAGARIGRRRMATAVLVVVLILMPVTWIRNNDWKTDVRLFEKEYRLSGPLANTLRLLTAAHQRRGNLARGVELCDRHSDRIGEYKTFSHQCGLLYAETGRVDDAERALKAALEADNEVGSDASTHGSLAILYLRSGRPLEAALEFQRAIDTERNPAVKVMRKGFMLAYLFPKDTDKLAEAKREFEEAYEMEPLLGVARTFAERMDDVIKSLAAESSQTPVP